jgi:hypothetical protein
LVKYINDKLNGIANITILPVYKENKVDNKKETTIIVKFIILP